LARCVERQHLDKVLEPLVPWVVIQQDAFQLVRCADRVVPIEHALGGSEEALVIHAETVEGDGTRRPLIGR
jgi:hypothetical protein